MSKSSRILLILMSIAFGLCILGLAGGMAYSLFALAARHRSLDQVLGNSTLFYKILGGLGVVGFAFFLLFLVASVSTKPKS